MYTLRNDDLEIAILDPVADRERLGTRCCTRATSSASATQNSAT